MRHATLIQELRAVEQAFAGPIPVLLLQSDSLVYYHLFSSVSVFFSLSDTEVISSQSIPAPALLRRWAFRGVQTALPSPSNTVVYI